MNENSELSIYFYFRSIEIESFTGTVEDVSELTLMEQGRVWNEWKPIGHETGILSESISIIIYDVPLRILF